jgi:UPF0755 protein
MVFRVERGDSFRDIAANLEKQRLIRWWPMFQFYVLASGKAHQLQAGCYSFSSGMSISKIAGILSSGSVAKKKITIPEGFTSSQIQQLLNETRSDRVSLGDYEGYLFPDTYEIPYCTGQEKIVAMMTDNFKKKTAGLKITPEIVIMASVLEEEVKTKEEKELVSGLLWKRFKAGMPLQVDAAPETYERLGLPEKPISNPGLDSILAAIYYKDSPYWYYLSKPDGVTIFSKTLEEHNIAKAKYLKP